MSPQYYVETTPSGAKQFVYRRSNSHNHHHHERHADVTREEWRLTLEQLHNLRTTNEALKGEVQILSASVQQLQGAEQEARRLQGVVHHLQHQNASLVGDVNTLRRALDEARENSDSRAHRELRRERREREAAEQAANQLRAANRELRVDNQNLKVEARSFQDRIRDLLRSNQTLAEERNRLATIANQWHDRADDMEAKANRTAVELADSQQLAEERGRAIGRLNRRIAHLERVIQNHDAYY